MVVLGLYGEGAIYQAFMHVCPRFLFPWGGNRCAESEGRCRGIHRPKDQVMVGMCTIPAIVGPRVEYEGGWEGELPVRYIM